MNEWMDRRARLRVPWWTYDAGLVLFAALAWVSARALQIGADPRWVYLPSGEKFGDTCLWLTLTGTPCPQCGMTRAFVYAAHGDWLTAFLMNPAGFALFGWILVGGAIGAYRLLRRSPRVAHLPQEVLVGWVLFWLVGLYLVPYLLRLFGINALP